MANDNKIYSVIIYTENQIGLLSQFTNIFTRRNLDIWSLLALPTDFQGIHYLTIVTCGQEKKVREAVVHLENILDVLKAFYYPGDLIAVPDKDIMAMSEKKVMQFLEERKNINDK